MLSRRTPTTRGIGALVQRTSSTAGPLLRRPLALSKSKAGSPASAAVLAASSPSSSARSFFTLGGRKVRRVTGNVSADKKDKPTSKGNAAPVPSGPDKKPKFVIALKDVGKYLPDGTPLFEDVTLSLLYGAKIGVIGINGAGKSSLLKVFANETGSKGVEGEVTRYEGVTVGMLEQEPHLDPNLSVFENVMAGVQEKWEILLRYRDLSNQLEQLEDNEANVERRLELVQKISAMEPTVRQDRLLDLERRVRRAMDALRCPDDSKPVEALSGGERRRVALCRLLINEPDLLLLDEPTNHLDAGSVAWLESHLSQYKGTVVAVTHDRYFLENITNWMIEVDRGQVIGYEGNYSGFLTAKSERLNREEGEDKSRQRLLDRELEWIRKTPKGRMGKNIARVKRYEEMLAESRRRKYSAGTISIPIGPRLGDFVFRASDLSASVPMGEGSKVLFNNVNFTIEPNSIVGIVGPNGAGKTTLLNLLAKERAPDSGTLQTSSTVRLAYVSQSRAELEDNETVYDCIAEGRDTIEYDMSEGTVISTRAFVASFNFKGTDQSKLVGQLSGGERNRVHLAKLLKRAPNVIFLDEPTNDLDLEVLRNLENAIAEFAGAAVIVSHDRYFLDRVCTHILALDGHGGFKYFDGNYRQFSHWLENDAARTDPEFVSRQKGDYYKKIEAA